MATEVRGMGGRIAHSGQCGKLRLADTGECNSRAKDSGKSFKPTTILENIRRLECTDPALSYESSSASRYYMFLVAIV
jgi:hypothetical protein